MVASASGVSLALSQQDLRSPCGQWNNLTRAFEQSQLRCAESGPRGGVTQFRSGKSIAGPLPSAPLPVAFESYLPPRRSCAELVPFASDVVWLLSLLRQVPEALQHVGVKLVYTSRAPTIASADTLPTASGAATPLAGLHRKPPPMGGAYKSPGYSRAAETLCNAIASVAQASSAVCASASHSPSESFSAGDASHKAKIQFMEVSACYIPRFRQFDDL